MAELFVEVVLILIGVEVLILQIIGISALIWMICGFAAKTMIKLFRPRE